MANSETGARFGMWRGRLLGYERPGIQRPWLLERLARVLHRGTREVPWEDVDWSAE